MLSEIKPTGAKMKNFRGQKSSFHEFNHMNMQSSVALTSVVARPNDIL